MKKIICVLLSIMMMFGMVSALATGAVDLSAMSEEELQSLYLELVSRIQMSKQGDTVFDEDGISVKWLGIEKDTLSFILSNNTGHDIEVKVKNYALNGMLLGPHWNMDDVAIMNGYSYMSNADRVWIFDNDVIGKYGITHVDSVTIILKIEDKATGEETEKAIAFAVDEDV